MDGTLLGADSQLSPTTTSLLSEAIRGGALFTVATARTPATAVPLLAGLPLMLPLIVLSGAACWDPRQALFSNVMALAPDTIRAIDDIMRRHGLRPFIYRHTGSQLHVYHYGAMHPAEQQFINQRLHTSKIFHLSAPDYATAPGDAIVCLAMNEYERLEAVHADVNANVECRALLSRDLFDPAIGLLEIYATGATKAQAIRRLADELDAERIVVFGDNINDIEMMQAASVAVAVQNAIPAVRDIASTIIGPNTDDSVARYILAHTK